MTRDGYKAIDGIVKDSVMCSNALFGDFTSEVTTTIPVIKKKGYIIQIGLYINSGDNGSEIELKIYNRVVDDANDYENLLYSANVIVNSSNYWVFNKPVRIPYVNMDEKQKSILYIRLTKITGTNSFPYSGAVLINTIEAE